MAHTCRYRSNKWHTCRHCSVGFVKKEVGVEVESIYRRSVGFCPPDARHWHFSLPDKTHDRGGGVQTEIFRSKRHPLKLV